MKVICKRGIHMRTILAGIYVFFFLLLGIPVLAVDWIIRKFNPKLSGYCQLRIVQWGFRCISFLSGIQLTVIGEENVPKDQAVLYIGNHRSIFDIVITYARCPGLTGYISKGSVDKVPVLGIIMRRLYCLFLDREDMKQGLKVILQAIEYIKQGISICVFPEGTRNKDTEHPESLLSFKEGTFKIAQKTNCPIIPIAMTGTADIFENHFPWIKRTKVTLVYGTPIIPSELDKDTQKHLGAYTQNIIQNMLLEQLEK